MDLSRSAHEAPLPKGVKDFLPLNATRINFLRNTLYDVYETWGFSPVIPPSLEYLHVLEKGLGAEMREQTFRLDDRQSGKLVTFSPDLTPQIARIVATRMRGKSFPLRLHYSGHVLRHTEQQAGKDREIFQSGAELIGPDGPQADAEMIALVVECFEKLGVQKYTIDIGQTEFLKALLEDLSLSPATLETVSAAVARKDATGIRQILEQTEISKAKQKQLLALPRLFGDRSILDKARQIVDNPQALSAIDYLERVVDILASFGMEDRITIDLGEQHGLDYHTGIAFSGYVPGIGQAVCSGGRYNNLTAAFGYPAPATGFSFNIHNLLFALDKSIDKAAQQQLDITIFMKKDNPRELYQVARALRQQGFKTATDLLSKSEDEALKAAQKADSHLLFVLDGNAQANIITVSSGDHRAVTCASIVAATANIRF